MQQFNEYRQQILIHASYIAPHESPDDLEVFVWKLDNGMFIAKLISWDRSRPGEEYRELLTHRAPAPSLTEAYKTLFEITASLMYRGTRHNGTDVIQSIED